MESVLILVVLVLLVDIMAWKFGADSRQGKNWPDRGKGWRDAPGRGTADVGQGDWSTRR